MSKNIAAACQAQACDVQDCMTKNIYNPEACDAYMRKLYECCQQMYATNEAAASTACPMRSVVERWLERHAISVNKEPRR